MAYTSEAFLAIENERIFTEPRVVDGFAHELARPGDVRPDHRGGAATPPRAHTAERGVREFFDDVPLTRTSSSSTPPETFFGRSGAPITPGRTDSTVRSAARTDFDGLRSACGPDRLRPLKARARAGELRPRGTTGSSSTRIGVRSPPSRSWSPRSGAGSTASTSAGPTTWSPSTSARWPRTGSSSMENFIEPYHVQFGARRDHRAADRRPLHRERVGPSRMRRPRLPATRTREDIALGTDSGGTSHCSPSSRSGSISRTRTACG